MLKKSIYGKTKRFSLTNAPKIEVTEKLNGANMAIFKKDGVIYVAQRNNIFDETELDKVNYKGLQGWMTDHLQELKDNLHEGSVICGEWLTVDDLKHYYEGRLDKHFYQFAKANINEKFDLWNVQYYHENFGYSWDNDYRPDFIGEVPVVRVSEQLLDINELNHMYDVYALNQDRWVEGFVVNYMNSVVKYVRRKSGQLEDHHE